MMKLFYIVGYANGAGLNDQSLLIEAPDVEDAKRLWHQGILAKGITLGGNILRAFEVHPTGDTPGILWWDSEGCVPVA